MRVTRSRLFTIVAGVVITAAPLMGFTADESTVSGPVNAVALAAPLASVANPALTSGRGGPGQANDCLRCEQGDEIIPPAAQAAGFMTWGGVDGLAMRTKISETASDECGNCDDGPYPPNPEITVHWMTAETPKDRPCEGEGEIANAHDCSAGDGDGEYQWDSCEEVHPGPPPICSQLLEALALGSVQDLSTEAAAKIVSAYPEAARLETATGRFTLWDCQGTRVIDRIVSPGAHFSRRPNGAQVVPTPRQRPHK